ncbi:MAG: FadR family transcriptional regulator [Deltaproteobacteria bacterium]|nr:FadR family transcriptional regulator [Deltaproteobacteria bacterium]MBW1871653.1 FadR family transcriptional regulator [Deltaproteobacteria bacterium]
MSQLKKKSTVELFEPVEISSTSELVAEAIRKTILAGDVSPGDTLPPERTLAERFRVTRNTVREALKRLEYSRLVSIRQGSGVKVLDYLAHAGLEFVTTLFGSKAASQNEMVTDLVQARAVVGEAIYHHAIDHFNPKALDSLRESVDDLAAEADKARPDVRKLQELDFEVQHRLLRGGKNRTIILLHNSIRYIYGGIAHLFEPLVEKPQRLVQEYRRLLTDLETGNRRGAKQIITVIFAMQQLAMARKLPRGGP